MITKQLKLFITIRLIMALIILIIFPLYNKENLIYPDLDIVYLEESIPLYQMPNPLYSALVRWINYSSENIISYKFIVLSIALNVSFSSIFIYLSSKIHSKKNSTYYSIILSSHPYLSLYTLKLDTSLFAILPIGIFCSSILIKKWDRWNIICISFFSFFRNAILPFGWLVVFKNLGDLRNSFKMVGLVSLSLSSLINLNYGFRYLQQNFSCYSFSNIRDWIINLNIDSQISNIIAYIITPILHLVLDLSAREAIAIYCLNLSKELAAISWIHYGSTFLFLIFHSWLLWKLVKFIYYQSKVDKNTLGLFLPLSILIPTLYGTAHMRYLIPLIPMLILFIFEIKSPVLKCNKKT